MQELDQLGQDENPDEELKLKTQEAIDQISQSVERHKKMKKEYKASRYSILHGKYIEATSTKTMER